MPDAVSNVHQQLVAGKIVGPGVEPAIVILLKDHTFKIFMFILVNAG